VVGRRVREGVGRSGGGVMDMCATGEEHCNFALQGCTALWCCTLDLAPAGSLIRERVCGWAVGTYVVLEAGILHGALTAAAVFPRGARGSLVAGSDDGLAIGVALALAVGRGRVIRGVARGGRHGRSWSRAL
jgi:hypothetical protein